MVGKPSSNGNNVIWTHTTAELTRWEALRGDIKVIAALDNASQDLPLNMDPDTPPPDMSSWSPVRVFTRKKMGINEHMGAARVFLKAFYPCPCR